MKCAIFLLNIIFSNEIYFVIQILTQHICCRPKWHCLDYMIFSLIQAVNNVTYFLGLLQTFKKIQVFREVFWGILKKGLLIAAVLFCKNTFHTINIFTCWFIYHLTGVLIYFQDWKVLILPVSNQRTTWSTWGKA